MTDRVQSLTVMLDQDYRTDDVQMIVDAIAMIKGVHRVELGDAVSSSDWFARERARMDLASKIYDVLKPEKA
jgi:hypothetical protein